jgi:hypothetical protein
MNWIGQHLGAAIGLAIASSSLLTALALKFAEAKLPGFIKEGGEHLLDLLFAKLTRPEDKIALKAILEAVRVRCPDAGDAIFAVAADDMILAVPALKPYRDSIIKLLTAIEQAAEDAIEDEEKKP